LKTSDACDVLGQKTGSTESRQKQKQHQAQTKRETTITEPFV